MLGIFLVQKKNQLEFSAMVDWGSNVCHVVTLDLPLSGTTICSDDFRFRAETFSRIPLEIPLRPVWHLRAYPYSLVGYSDNFWSRYWRVQLDIAENIRLLKRTSGWHCCGWCEGFQGFLQRVIITSVEFYAPFLIKHLFTP